MKKTKIFYGNQHVDSMYCGKTRLDVIRFWIKRLVWRSMCTMALLSVIGWSMYFGSAYIPRTVYADREIIKEVEVKAPVMERIAKCESGGKHFAPSGQVIVNVNNNKTYDIGKYQINSIWNKKATELGYNLYIEKDNEAFAMWLYRNYGSEPWSASKANCWNK